MRRISRVVLILALLGGIVWLVLPQGRTDPQQQVLPDGTIVRLEAVTYGSGYDLLPGPRFQWLPGRLLRRPAPRFPTWGSEDPDAEAKRLIFWVSSEFTGGQDPLLRSEHYTFVFDEHGCEVPVIRSQSEVRLGVGTRAVHAFMAPAFPRRSATLGLRLPWPTATGTGTGAEFRILNPAPRAEPMWEAQPRQPPVTARVGDLEFRLTELLTDLSEVEPSRPVAPGEARLTQLHIETRKNGAPLPGWEPARLQIADAAGNRWTRSPMAANAGHALFHGGLWPCEPAWHLTADMARSRQGEFAAEELVTFAALPIPAEGVVVPHEEERSSPEGAVRLMTMRRYSSEDLFQGGHVEVYVSLATERADAYLTLIRASDDQDRELPEPSFTGGLGGRMSRVRMSTPDPGWRYAISVLPEPDARSLTLTFAIQRAVTVEFLAAPQQLVEAGGEGR